jgi:quercetin dioxygenase-like cupin family protein
VVLLSLALSVSAQSPSDQPQVIPVYQEPMHRLVLDRPPVRVLDVEVLPGATSLSHLHTDPIFYVAIDISEIDAQTPGEEWKRTKVSAWTPGGVAYDLGHADQPLTHRIRNVGDEPFRLIAVTNGGPPAPLAGPGVDAALPGDLETEIEWFRQSRVTLAPATTGVRIQSRFPVVIVQVSPGRAELSDGEGQPQKLATAGDFAFAEPGRVTALRNPGPDPVTLVVIEAR